MLRFYLQRGEPWGAQAGQFIAPLSWRAKAALVALTLIVLIPVALLVLAAMAVAAVGFGLFMVGLMVRQLVRAAAGLLLGVRGDGRRNVRVIERS
jgi:hypothetical protein